MNHPSGTGYRYMAGEKGEVDTRDEGGRKSEANEMAANLSTDEKKFLDSSSFLARSANP